jgi:hypothetical protein
MQTTRSPRRRYLCTTIVYTFDVRIISAYPQHRATQALVPVMRRRFFEPTRGGAATRSRLFVLWRFDLLSSTIPCRPNDLVLYTTRRHY